MFWLKGEQTADLAILHHHGHTDTDQPLDGGNWWDLYNVSTFLQGTRRPKPHVFILSMPLFGVNDQPGAIWHNETAAGKNKHFFFEDAGLEDDSIKFFLEPVINTLNFIEQDSWYS